MFEPVIDFVRDIYKTDQFIPLHEPRFWGKEKEYLNNCIDSTFVSSVGKYVDRFEKEIADFTGAKYAVATVNGTAALHIALLLAGIGHGDEVITQALTFVATCNAINYTGAHPILVDVDKDTLGMSPQKLEEFLEANTEIKKGKCYNTKTGRAIKAVVPMHTFGLPAKLEELQKLCNKYNLKLIEDAAESLGSYRNDRHTGTLGWIGTLSFNGNKIITTGGGGMILTNNAELAKRAKHITTTAKVPHKWEYRHDQVAYNYRLPNINAALGCAQMEQLPTFIKHKRELAESYRVFFENQGIQFVTEPSGTRSNYWLNAVLLKDREERDSFLKETNEKGVMTRPAWQLMNELSMYKGAQCGDLSNSEWLEARIVNIPSSVSK
ncbi:LegC family aminotransferase [Flavobacteriaceae bacterium D16]|nr:LegC family aminotransferase [Flavobacteriaceae bacterium D16]